MKGPTLGFDGLALAHAEGWYRALVDGHHRDGIHGWAGRNQNGIIEMPGAGPENPVYAVPPQATLDFHAATLSRVLPSMRYPTTPDPFITPPSNNWVAFKVQQPYRHYIPSLLVLSGC